MAAYKDEERGTWYVSFHYNDFLTVIPMNAEVVCIIKGSIVIPVT